MREDINMSYQDFILRIVISFLLSFCIGLERQWRRRAIGLRTNVLVCIGAFLFVSFSMQTNPNDISRIAAQVVSGIGFFGAGVILKDKANIKGLNTAATLWCNAAIGTLCAVGLLIEASIGTICILFANIILRSVTQKLNMNYNAKLKTEQYRLKVIVEEEKEFVVRTLISQSVNQTDIILTNIENSNLEDGKVKIYATFKITAGKTKLLEELINRIVIEPGVISSGWNKISHMKSEEIDDDDEI